MMIVSDGSERTINDVACLSICESMVEQRVG
jgi:hypothetical protein